MAAYDPNAYRVFIVDLDSRKGKAVSFAQKSSLLGGSALAAALYRAYGLPDAPWNDPGQPLIFAIGPLNGYFPLMSKTVCAFRSPYNGNYTESHAGGRLSMSMRFAGFDAIVFRGKAQVPTAVSLGSRQVEFKDVHYLWGKDAFITGKYLRKVFSRQSSGHRSIFRIGPAGENGSAFACINVDTFRHFGRLGCGAVMGAKNLKGVAVNGDLSFPLPEGKDYYKLYREVFDLVVKTPAMKKYHDLGTPENIIPMNELSALPWRNMQATRDDEKINSISGESFAEHLLLRKTACSGCPVGCIHVGLQRETFGTGHETLYRQVTYDHEPIFACGSMLGMNDASSVLAILDEAERQGLDVISAGVVLAWATEAFEKGVISEKETYVPLKFGDEHNYREAVRHIGAADNDFYKACAQGTLYAAKAYGGEDYACVTGQEMAGYATGEVCFVSQALGFRHSHLDSGGYSYDQKNKDKDLQKAVKYMVDDEVSRVALTSAVACLFARSIYTHDRLSQAFDSVGLKDAAANLSDLAEKARRERWRLKVRTGYDPRAVKIPKRYTEVVNWKGPIDADYMEKLRLAYADAIMEMGREEEPEQAKTPAE